MTLIVLQIAWYFTIRWCAEYWQCRRWFQLLAAASYAAIWLWWLVGALGGNAN